MSSVNDKAILNSILYPFLPAGDFADEETVQLKDDVEITEEVIKARNQEKVAIALAEKGNLDEALKTLTETTQIAFQLPSVYNNRAQVYRLMGDTENALKDLNKAISLSNGQGKSGCQALCQRGQIHRKNGDEAAAEHDFRAASLLGSPFAKMQLVEMNPYAKLCNQMISQVINQLKVAQ